MTEYDLFADIESELKFQRKGKPSMGDRYIEQFSSVWRGINPETGGVTGDYIPESYAQDCLKLAQGYTKHPVTGRWLKKGTTLWRDGSIVTGTNQLVITQGTSKVIITEEQY